MEGRPISLACLLFLTATGLTATASRPEAQVAGDVHVSDAVWVPHTSEKLPAEVVKDGNAPTPL